MVRFPLNPPLFFSLRGKEGGGDGVRVVCRKHGFSKLGWPWVVSEGVKEGEERGNVSGVPQRLKCRSNERAVGGEKRGEGNRGTKVSSLPRFPASRACTWLHFIDLLSGFAGR